MRQTYRAVVTRSSRGLTLLELVLVILILAILSVYAMTNNSDSSEMTLTSQAQRLASDIRLAQTLAFTSGSQMEITSSASGYSVACVGTCDHSNDFGVTLQKGITLSGTASVSFKTSGEPTSAATYTLTAGSSTKTVGVAAVTGHVTP